MNELVIELSNVTTKPVPFDYEYYLYSSLLSCITKVNPEFADYIHNFKGGPLFALGPLVQKGEGSIDVNGIKYSTFNLSIRSNQVEMMQKFDEIFNVGQELVSERFNLSIKQKVMRKIIVDSNIATINSLSPVILRNKDRIFIRPEDRNYTVCLKDGIERRSRKIHNNTELSIKKLALLDYKNKVKTIHGGFIPCSIIKFDIWADIEIIQDIIETGIGMKNQLGFGMVNLF